MENESRIVELLAETLIKQDQMISELAGVRSEVIKLNLQTAENTRAIIKLANEFEKVISLNDRVTKLEHTVYK
ncbi:MAG: hypothetical protein ACKVOQ_00880 [Cyclobacteriaceae bacterium]